MFDIPSTDSLVLTESHEKRAWLGPVWDVLSEAYRNVAGGLHYASPEAMLRETHAWEIIHKHQSVQAVLLYKRKHGLKMVALGIAATADRREAGIRLGRLIEARLNEAWIEVSERAEAFVLRHGGEALRIPSHHAGYLTGKPLLGFHDDGFHYVREIQGIPKLKLIVGTPEGYGATLGHAALSRRSIKAGDNGRFSHIGHFQDKALPSHISLISG